MPSVISEEPKDVDLNVAAEGPAGVLSRFLQVVSNIRRWEMVSNPGQPQHN